MEKEIKKVIRRSIKETKAMGLVDQLVVSLWFIYGLTPIARWWNPLWYVSCWEALDRSDQIKKTEKEDEKAELRKDKQFLIRSLSKAFESLADGKKVSLKLNLA